MSRASFAFLGFVVLLASRDIWWEVSLQETEAYAAFAALLWGVTAACCSVILTRQRRILPLLRKLGDVKLLARVLVYGALSGGLYALGFFLVSRMGAGAFNMVEYAIYPIAVMFLAVVLERSRFEKQFLVDMSLYILGLSLMLWGNDMSGLGYLGLALLMPFITATTDYLTKYLLDAERGGLTKAEVLLLRSVPAGLTVAVYAMCFTSNGLRVHAIGEASLASFVCGFIPLWLLCTSLDNAEMKYLARWFCLVPAIAYFGTLHLHWNEHSVVQTCGAATIVVAWFLGFAGFTKAFWLYLSKAIASSSASPPRSFKSQKERQ